MRESAVEARLHRGVLARGGLSFKVVSTGAGVPDRMVLFNGVVWLVEVKAVGGRLSPIQRAWHAKAAERGVHVHVVVGPEGVDEWLGQLERGEL